MRSSHLQVTWPINQSHTDTLFPGRIFGGRQKSTSLPYYCVHREYWNSFGNFEKWQILYFLYIFHNASFAVFSTSSAFKFIYLFIYPKRSCFCRSLAVERITQKVVVKFDEILRQLVSINEVWWQTAATLRGRRQSQRNQHTGNHTETLARRIIKKYI